MSRKLYEIHDAIERILAEHVDPETGEITPEADAALDQLDMEREAKLLACGRYALGEKLEARKAKAIAGEYKAEAEKFERRARTHENRAERIRAYMERHMTPGEKAGDERVRLWWHTSHAVEVAPSAKLEEWPREFVRLEPRKTALKQALDAGRTVPDGVTVVTRKKLVVS